MADSELTPAVRPSRCARKRDEAVRRIRLCNPALDSPAASLAVRRLAQLTLLSEKLYARCKAAETDDDPQAFILAVESLRRCAQTASLLEKNLRLAVSVVDPPSNLAVELARRIRDQRAAAGTEVVFSPSASHNGREGQNWRVSNPSFLSRSSSLLRERIDQIAASSAARAFRRELRAYRGVGVIRRTRIVTVVIQIIAA